MTITIRATKDRISNCVTMNEIAGMQEGNFLHIRNLLAKMLVDPATDEYYPLEIYNIVDGEKTPVTLELSDDETVIAPNPLAVARIGNITPKRLEGLSRELQHKLKDGAVPLPNGRG